MRDDVRESSRKTLSIVAYVVGLTSGAEQANCRNVQIVRARTLRGLTGDWDDACATAIRRLGMERLIRAKIFLCLNAEL